MNEPIRTLYHYTDIEGALGILEKKELWATALSHMNDASEMLVFLDAVELVVKKRGEGLKRDVFEQNVRKMAQYVFAFSLSTEDDLLSQWRSYCPQEGGIAIGFDVEEIKNQMRRQDANTMECIYSDFSDLDETHPIIDAIEKIVMKGVEDQLAALSEQQLKMMEKAIGVERKIIGFYSEVLRQSPQFKHSGFREENEWRIVRSVYPLGQSQWDQIQFRARGGQLTPYTKLMIDKSCVKRIVVGPGQNKELTGDTFRALLQKSGFDQGTVDIAFSKLPYNP